MEQYWYYIGITFVIFCLYKAYQIFNSEYDKTVPEQDDRKTAFTLEQIAQYKGKYGQKTYVLFFWFFLDFCLKIGRLCLYHSYGISKEKKQFYISMSR